MNQSSQPPFVPFDPTPPTGPGAYASAAQGSDGSNSSWPGWIGGISIAIGGLTLLASCCGMAGIFSMKLMSGAMPIKFPDAPPALLLGMGVDLVASLVLSAFLLLGGIATLRRRSSGPRQLRRYAYIRIGLALPLLAIGFLMLGPATEWQAGIVRATNEFKESQKPPMSVSAEERAGETPGEATTWERAQVVGGCIIGLIYPTVILIVLAAPRRREEIERWES
jgi:membrane protein implicated in regulation of membrane protease activity